jgi:hypothetical protein
MRKWTIFFWHSDFPTMFSVSLIVYGQDHHSLIIRHVQYVLLITFNLQYIHWIRRFYLFSKPKRLWLKLGSKMSLLGQFLSLVVNTVYRYCKGLSACLTSKQLLPNKNECKEPRVPRLFKAFLFLCCL